MWVYIWTDKRWDETYTISKASSSSSSYSTNNISIYKSWYKITNILIEASWKSLNTSQSWVLGLDISNASSWHTECIQVYTSVGNSTSWKLEYQHSWSWTTISSSIWTLSWSWTNNYSLNITSEWVVTTIVNWTTNTFTLTWNGKLALDSILSWSSIYSEIYSRYWEIWPATVTVTYEQI